MAQNRTMQQKNLVNRKRIAQERKEARYRIMSYPKDPRNLTFESAEGWYASSDYAKYNRMMRDHINH